MLVFKLALRNILRNRSRSLLTGLTMLGSYVLIVVAFSVQEGTYGNILSLYTQDNSGHIQITHKTYQDKPSLYKTVNQPDELISQLESFQFVTSVTPRIHSAAIAYGSQKTTPALLVGIDVIREQNTSNLANKVSNGQFMSGKPDSDGYFQAMIGGGLARQLRLSVGDELVLISQGADGSLANDIFMVSAIVGDINAPERLNVYLPLTGIQQFLSMPNRVHQLIVLIDDYRNSIDRTEAIKTSLSSDLIDAGLDAFPWQIIEQEFYRVMKADIEGNVMSQYTIIFLVCIGILNTILMNILERTGEFGVLKAIGTTPRRIFNQIVVEAFLLAVLSCLLGLIIAIPVNWYLVTVGMQMPEPVDISGVFVESIIGYMSLWVFVRPAMIIIIAATMVALIPAYRAAKLEPLDAMRSL